MATTTPQMLCAARRAGLLVLLAALIASCAPREFAPSSAPTRPHQPLSMPLGVVLRGTPYAPISEHINQLPLDPALVQDIAAVRLSADHHGDRTLQHALDRHLAERLHDAEEAEATNMWEAYHRLRQQAQTSRDPLDLTADVTQCLGGEDARPAHALGHFPPATHHAQWRQWARWHWPDAAARETLAFAQAHRQVDALAQAAILTHDHGETAQSQCLLAALLPRIPRVAITHRRAAWSSFLRAASHTKRPRDLAAAWDAIAKDRALRRYFGHTYHLALDVHAHARAIDATEVAQRACRTAARTPAEFIRRLPTRDLVHALLSCASPADALAMKVHATLHPHDLLEIGRAAHASGDKGTAIAALTSLLDREDLNARIHYDALTTLIDVGAHEQVRPYLEGAPTPPDRLIAFHSHHTYLTHMLLERRLPAQPTHDGPDAQSLREQLDTLTRRIQSAPPDHVVDGFGGILAIADTWLSLGEPEHADALLAQSIQQMTLHQHTQGSSLTGLGFYQVHQELSVLTKYLPYVRHPTVLFKQIASHLGMAPVRSVFYETFLRHDADAMIDDDLQMQGPTHTPTFRQTLCSFIAQDTAHYPKERIKLLLQAASPVHPLACMKTYTQVFDASAPPLQTMLFRGLLDPLLDAGEVERAWSLARRSKDVEARIMMGSRLLWDLEDRGIVPAPAILTTFKEWLSMSESTARAHEVISLVHVRRGECEEAVARLAHTSGHDEGRRVFERVVIRCAHALPQEALTDLIARIPSHRRALHTTLTMIEARMHAPPSSARRP